MNLLYCDANGVVFTVHDDKQMAVPMSAYPNVVRILPYDQPLSTLDRVGDVLPDPMSHRAAPGPDQRPYAQPTETPALLKLYAAQKRFERSTGGFEFNAASGAFAVNSDRESYLMVGNLAQYASTLSPTTPIDFTQGTQHNLLTAAECATLFNQFTALIQQGRTIEAQCITDLDSASPTIHTYADIDARFE